MFLSNLVSKSSFCSVGCISKTDDIQNLKKYIKFNENVISKFPKVIIVHTKADHISDEDFNKYNQVWFKFFGDKVILIQRPNFGYTFGFIDLDKTAIEISKKNGFDYTWKSTNDVLITTNIFNVQKNEDENFLFLQGHGLAGMAKYKFNEEIATNSFKDDGYESFFPQVNFFITTTKTDELVDDKLFFDLYNKYLNDPEFSKTDRNPSYKYAACEDTLAKFVYRNKLKCKHLIGKESYKKLLKFVISFKVIDPSHKNIFFKECGICHLHFPNEQVIEI